MVSAGRILILPKGVWSNLTSYSMLDLVTGSDNKAYLAKQTSVGQNPTTDDGTYWQLFGSTVSADGTTIIDDGAGNISVNIDNDTIKYDSDNGYLYVDADEIEKALDDITDVSISAVSNGQVLQYNSTSQKWENKSITVSASVATLTDVNLTNLGDGEILKYDSNSSKWVNSTESSGGHTYLDGTGVTMAQRSKAQFKDLTVTDESGNDRTVISAEGKADKSDLTSISETGSTASQTISSGTYFYLNGSLVRAIADISSGSTFTLNTNYKVVNGALNDVGVLMGARVDLTSYTKNAPYTFPQDGMLSVVAYNNVQLGSYVMGSQGFGANYACTLNVYAPASKFNSVCVFVRKGMKFGFDTTVPSGSAGYFYPLI